MRTRYSAEQKAKLVLEALRGERTVQQIASENNIAPNLLTRWKSEAISNLPQLFESEKSKLRGQAKNHEAQVEAPITNTLGDRLCLCVSSPSRTFRVSSLFSFCANIALTCLGEPQVAEPFSSPSRVLPMLLAYKHTPII